ncbi:hypothetical protein [Novosphingobium sp. BL-52-GroH]|uniref:hypothetical protein n=1 Tax=Novosphingobium sp. BL-52-GroH TaxID=3349877 RepID=UPI00385035EA
MKRVALAGTALAALAAWPQAAGASGDYGCSPGWTLATSSFECAGSAVIGPRNDTRVNLAFLLRDRAGIAAPGKLAYPARGWENADFGHVFLGWDELQAAFWPRPQTTGEGTGQDYAGSRCQTLGSGGEAFRAALSASKALKPGERETLAAARDLVKPACDGDKGQASWPALSSAAGQGYLAYLQGARAFYADDFAVARARFADLARSREPWLAQTARYMAARTELAAAQAGAFDEWGGYAGGDKVDRASAERAGRALQDYLSAYPKGLYAASAAGLTRRVAWLLGEGPVLARSYAALLATQSPLAPQSPALIEEVESKVLFGTGLGADADAPVLLATWDLLRMRRYAQDDRPLLVSEVPEPLTSAQLAAQQPAFAGAPDLYAYLQASFAYHVARDYRRVLALVPDDARAKSFTPLAFSRQMLRGLALEKLGDRNAAGFFQQMTGGARDLYQRPAVELALAMHWERSGELTKVFAPSSPITEPEIRTLLLAHVAGPDLLRRQAGAREAGQVERDVALFTLIAKDLGRGRYADGVADLALVPANASTTGWVGTGWTGGWMSADPESRPPVGLFLRGKFQEDYVCPALARTVAALAARPGDVKARLCLAEFYRLNGFDDYLADRDHPPGNQLGGTAGLFPGKVTPRAGLYAAVLADRSATPEDTAYALYRSVMCYAPSRNNSCGGADASEAQRRAWFQRLKRDYPKSKWAIDLKYYW